MNRLKHLSPAWRRRQEREMREELDALAAIAGSKELGNLTLAIEDARATWGWTWLDAIFVDVRYSLRTLRKQPAFISVAVLSLALAIGANSAIFSLGDAMLLRPLPIRNPAAAFDVESGTPGNPLEGMSLPDYRDLRNASRSFSGLAAYRIATLTVAALYESRVTDTWLQFFQMVGTMGFIGLALATTGLYGLVAYTVSRRVKEFGVRVAVGARRRDVVWLVERRGLILAVVGIGIGGALTAAAEPWLAAGFPGLGVSSPTVYVSVPLALLLVCGIASYLPARRAAGMDPLRALRNE